MQTITAQYEAAIKEHEADKIKNEAALICTQEDELVKNGKSKRELEDAQEAVAREQVNLYIAQAKGYADKNRNDTLKSVLNSWAVQATEVDPDSSNRNLNAVVGSTLTGSVESAKRQAGL